MLITISALTTLASISICITILHCKYQLLNNTTIKYLHNTVSELVKTWLNTVVTMKTRMQMLIVSNVSLEVYIIHQMILKHYEHAQTFYVTT